MTMLLMTAGTALLGLGVLASDGIRALDATRPSLAPAPPVTGAIAAAS